ncbi:MAG: hypothetical protein KF819_00095 [Labilithrix sp.]|nr:hypothetical protein [Labilithrix sp.]
MRSSRLLLIAALACCGESAVNAPDPTPTPVIPSDGGPPPIPPGDSGTDAQPPGPRTSCLDRPTELSRPPTNRLPCELIPPGLSL